MTQKDDPQAEIPRTPQLTHDYVDIWGRISSCSDTSGLWQLYRYPPPDTSLFGRPVTDNLEHSEPHTHQRLQAPQEKTVSGWTSALPCTGFWTLGLRPQRQPWILPHFLISPDSQHYPLLFLPPKDRRMQTPCPRMCIKLCKLIKSVIFQIRSGGSPRDPRTFCNIHAMRFIPLIYWVTYWQQSNSSKHYQKQVYSFLVYAFWDELVDWVVRK